MTTNLWIGALAIGLGLAAFLTGLFRWEKAFRLSKVQFIEQKWGPMAARLVYVLLGVLLIAIGLLICFDIRPAYSRRRVQSMAATIPVSAC